MILPKDREDRTNTLLLIAFQRRGQAGRARFIVRGFYLYRKSLGQLAGGAFVPLPCASGIGESELVARIKGDVSFPRGGNR